MDFVAVYRAHFARVWRTLRRFGVAERDALDATQEVFVTAFRQWQRFEGRSSVATWLYRIAYGVAADRWRRAPAQREVLCEQTPEPLGAGLDARELMAQRDLLRLLEDVLATLTIEQRAVLTMFEMEGCTGQEIAEILGIPLGTVRSRLRLARRAFSRALHDRMQDCRARKALGGC